MKLLQSTFTGIGQIFLQEKALSGVLIVVAMFFSHWTLGVSAFLGALAGTLTAKWLKFSPAETAQGLYGFNGSLAWMCVMFTFAETNATNPVIWVLGAVAAVVATLIMRAFMVQKCVAYTFPFVLTCWFFCWGVAHFKLFGLTQTTLPLADHTNTAEMWREPFYAWAEVNFGGSEITGILLFLAIAISSPNTAMWGVAAAVIGTALAQFVFGVEPNSLANGIYGFSPILVACAFAGKKRRDFAFVLVGVLLAVAIQFAVAQTGLAPYTIGFIVASWLVLWVKNRLPQHGFLPK